MKLRREATNALWVLVLGGIALFCFFAAIGALHPGDVVWLTVAVGVLAVLAAVHFIRVRHSLDEHAGELARTVHAMRETRGF
jgi:membrane protein implicated in regulation of membrane protease activity